MFTGFSKKNELALADLDAVLNVPKSQRLAKAAYYRGTIHADAGRFPEALEDFTLVITENPQFLPAYKPRARIHFARGNVEAGMKDLDTASLAEGRDPNGPEWQLHGNRGHALFRDLYGKTFPRKARGRVRPDPRQARRG